MKAMGITKLRKAVKDMRPGILLIRKADNQVMAFWSRIPECLEIDYDKYMIYFKEPKKC